MLLLLSLTQSSFVAAFDSLSYSYSWLFHSTDSLESLPAHSFSIGDIKLESLGMVGKKSFEQIF